MERDAPAQIRQPECALSIAAIGRADELEKCLILGDRQQLPLAEHPARRGIVAGEHPNFTNIWLCHEVSPLVRAWEDPLQCDAEVERQKWLHVQMRLAAAH